MRFEDFAYSFLGNNLVIGSHIRRQLAFLQAVIPEEWRGLRMDDLGCGDGKVTVLLRDILQPVAIRGYDVNASLVKRARKRGIDAVVLDLDVAVPYGEMAMLWGVLHHLRHFEQCLEKVAQHYSLVIIREPVRTGWNPLELGKPLRINDLIALFHRYFPDAQVHYCERSILVLYAAPDYLAGKSIARTNTEHRSMIYNHI